jgi:hypothetical protein
MAIYRVSGQMLQSTLVRDGNSIAFANTASSTATLFVDIANSRVGINSNVANVALDVVGNIAGGNIAISGLANVTGNISGGNLLTIGLISATGNLTSGNVGTGNVQAGNLLTTGIVSATANVTAGNILTIGLISATGNLTSGNVNTVLVSASGNVVAGNVVVGNILLPGIGNVTVGNVNINNLAEPSANSDAATKLYVDSKIGNISNIGNLTVNNTTISSVNANLVAFGGTSGIIIPAGNIDQRPSPATTATIRFNTINDTLEIYDGTNWVSGTGDISVITNQTLNGDNSTTVFTLDQAATAESILVSINGVLQTPSVDYTTSQSPDQITFTTAPAAGDVIQIRFISTTTTVAALYNGTSSINIPVSNGNAIISVGGTSNVLTVTSTGANILGYANVSGNISSGNILITGIMSATGNVSIGGVVSATGNITGGNVSTGGVVSATGNITGGNLSVSTGTITLGSIVNANGNGVGNIGSATTTFNTIFAKATSAQYADLAEYYSADAEYEPGTVLRFGGDQEVTLSINDADPCVAGVVSTNPSYIMNAGIFCEFPTQVALTGRVPCRVVGPVTKGAMMVSAGNGAARAEQTPAMGTVIGKALESFDGESGTIEIVVGRL